MEISSLKMLENCFIYYKILNDCFSYHRKIFCLALNFNVVTSFTSYQWYFCKGYQSGALLLFFTGNYATATVLAIYKLGPNLGRAVLYSYSFFNLGKNHTCSLLMYIILNLRSLQYSFQLYFLFV